MSDFTDRLSHAWNAFMNKDPTPRGFYGPSNSMRPDRARLARSGERTIVNAIYNRIANDAAQITIEHVRLDDNGRFSEIINSGLNNCLTLEANIDQTGRAFIKDAVLSMLDEGCVALVPIDTTINPSKSASFDVNTIRVAKIIEWYPRHIKVYVYNDNTGRKEEKMVPKSTVAIIENPFYSVMNEKSSVVQRLIQKLNLLDSVDEQSSAGKLDLIISLPYAVKSDARRQQAEKRRKDIEDQLAGSKYGIAYTDGTEHITQLNRSLENNLMKQIEYLTSMAYAQLGLTEEIMNSTANEEALNNYYNRTIEPILSTLVDEMKRKFLSKTARTQSQSICFFRDPFKLVPTTQLAELADKFTRNEIMTSNEIRQVVGMKPSADPNADMLRNANISQPYAGEEMPVDEYGEPVYEEGTEEEYPETME